MYEQKERRRRYLKISTQAEVNVFTLKIEGKVIGAWASELERVWKVLEPSLSARQLRLDICGVLYLDDKGKQVLREIVEAADAQILADSPLTKQFAAEARRGLRKRDREGT